MRVQVSASPEAAHHVGRRDITQVAPSDLITEAADYVEVLRRLWDSWEDDAEIRDVTTGRFIDRKKVHYIDFEGATFSVRGPSITPRPPQGQPIVAALSHGEATHGLVAGSADIGFITPHDAVEVTTTVDALSSLAIAEGVRSGSSPISPSFSTPARTGHPPAGSGSMNAWVLPSPPTQGCSSAAPLRLPTASRSGTRPERQASAYARQHSPTISVRSSMLVPELRRRGLFRGGEGATTLRGILGLPRPVSRYASA